RIVSFNTSAIQNTNPLSNLTQLFTNITVNFLRLLWCCRLACTHSPYWFVCHHGALEGVTSDQVQYSIQLSVNHRQRLASFTLRKPLPYTQDGDQLFAPYRATPFCNVDVRFLLPSTAFIVANNDVAALPLRQHPGRYLTRVCSPCMFTHTLSTQRYSRRCNQFLCVLQVRKGWTDNNFSVVLPLPTFYYLGQQCSVSALITVHFPVAYHQLATLGVICLVQAIPPPKRALMVAKMG